MDRQRGPARVELRALIFRPEHGYLIVRLTETPDGPWDLPGGPHDSHTDPERVLQQRCLEQVGCNVQILAGRPPLTFGRGTDAVTYRLYLCAVSVDEAMPLGCAAVRWAPPAALGEFVFTPEIREIVARLV